MNAAITNILQEYGIVAISDEGLVDKDTNRYLKNLFKKCCKYPSQKAFSSPALSLFDNCFFSGDLTHSFDDKKEYVLDRKKTFQYGKFNFRKFAPRFFIVVFQLEKKELLTIPVLTGRRGRQGNRNPGNLSDILHAFFRSVFDDSKIHNLNHDFYETSSMHYGVMLMGLKDVKVIHVVISGAIFEVKREIGSIIHYIGTDENLVYNKGFKTGSDGKLFKGNGIATFIIRVIGKISMLVGKNSSLYLRCTDNEYLWENFYSRCGFKKEKYDLFPSEVKESLSEIDSFLYLKRSMESPPKAPPKPLPTLPSETPPKSPPKSPPKTPSKTPPKSQSEGNDAGKKEIKKNFAEARRVILNKLPTLFLKRKARVTIFEKARSIIESRLPSYWSRRDKEQAVVASFISSDSSDYSGSSCLSDSSASASKSPTKSLTKSQESSPNLKCSHTHIYNCSQKVQTIKCQGWPRDNFNCVNVLHHMCMGDYLGEEDLREHDGSPLGERTLCIDCTEKVKVGKGSDTVTDEDSDEDSTSSSIINQNLIDRSEKVIKGIGVNTRAHRKHIDATGSGTKALELKRKHELRKRKFLKIEEENQCFHLGCFIKVGSNKWRGKLLNHETIYTLDYDVHISGTFKNSFLHKCRAVVNRMHPVPVGNSIITNETSSHEVCIGNCKFLPPHKGCPVVLYQQGDSDRCLSCGLASALAFFGASKTAHEIFHLRHGVKDYLITEWQLVYDKMERWVGKQFRMKKKWRKILFKVTHLFTILF